MQRRKKKKVCADLIDCLFDLLSVCALEQPVPPGLLCDVDHYQRQSRSHGVVSVLVRKRDGVMSEFGVTLTRRISILDLDFNVCRDRLLLYE